MLTKVTAILILQRDQRLLQCRPAENINTHGCKIAAWILRFLLKLGDPTHLIGHHNTKTTCFLHRYRHTGDCHICFICLVKIKHHLIIHLINMVTGQNQDIVRIILFHVIHILIDRIGRSCVPLTACTFFIWGKYSYTALVSVKIPRNTNTYMCIKP